MTNVTLVRKDNITELNTHADVYDGHQTDVFDDITWNNTHLNSVTLSFSQPTIMLEATSFSSPISKFDVEVEVGFTVKIHNREKQNITAELIQDVVSNMGLKEFCLDENLDN